MRKFDDGLEDLFPGINFEAWKREFVHYEYTRISDKYDQLIPSSNFKICRCGYMGSDLSNCRSGGIHLYANDAAAPSVKEVFEKGLGTGVTIEVTPIPEEKEKVDDIERRARKPPKDGPCRGCGKDKPLNRLFLCYPCWVSKMNKERGWRDGQPHPESCKCDLDCRFDDAKRGN